MSIHTQERARALRPVAVRVTAALVGLAALCGSGVLAASAAADTPAVSDLVLGVGADDTQRNLAWYTVADVAQVAQIAPTADVVDGVFPADAATVSATGGPTTSGEYNRFVTFTGLRENTAYSYRVGTEGAWSDVYSFRTQESDGEFGFLFFGDPQIGSSGNVSRDAQGWADTLDVATATYPDTELLFSAGDQVEHAANESEYAAFLTPDALREIPFVATNGNHDVGSKAYEQHFNTPNTVRSAGPGTGTSSGGDYWFIHDGALFIDLNSNSRDFASHEAFVRQVVAEHGDEAAWKVVAFHHSIYSPGPHATDTDVAARRNTWPTLFSELGIDLVLQGHDHSYARSYLIRNGEKADQAEQAGADEVVAGPGGVLYVTSNSASGSKYYDLQPQGFWWLSASNQERVRNYTAVEVTHDAITVKTLRSQANGIDKPVNSVVDEVTLERKFAAGTPTIHGKPKVGGFLTADAGAWTPEPELSYQWLVDGVPVEGASDARFHVLGRFLGKDVTVQVTGARVGYTDATVESDAVTVVTGSGH